MIDASLGSFDNIPRSTFLGAGLTFPNHTMEAGHVWWSADFVAQALAADPCASVDVVTWSGSAPMSFTSPSKSDKDITSQINIAPAFSAGSASQLALLGEAGKVTAVSTYRFAAEEPSASGLTAHLRGKAGEVIKLLFAKDGKCVAQTAFIGADGTGVATIPARELEPRNKIPRNKMRFCERVFVLFLLIDLSYDVALRTVLVAGVNRNLSANSLYAQQYYAMILP